MTPLTDKQYKQISNLSSFFYQSLDKVLSNVENEAQKDLKFIQRGRIFNFVNLLSNPN